MTTPTKLSLFHLATLDAPLTLGNGTVLPAGTEVMLLPQTTAASVLVDGGKSLAEVLPTMSTNVVDSSGQVIRLTDRLTRVETQFAALAAWAKQNGYTGA